MLDLRKEGKEKEIVKIQAHARGFLTRKAINEQLNAQDHGDTAGGAINRPSYNQSDPNYMNADVQNIRAQLGDFDFGDEPEGLGQRELRDEEQLENGAKYEGEWLVGTNVR